MLPLAIAGPFLLLLVLTLGFNRPLWQGGLVSLGAALLLWLGVSGVDGGAFSGPLAKAFQVSCEVGLILLGAILFLEYMHLTGTTDRVKQALGRFTSGDLALEALLLAWLFCGFLEGAAGFGAPAALVAPLLVSLGFPPVIAAVLPLVGDSAAVPFGAVGTPVRVGLDGLPAEAAGPWAAGINLFAGLVAPVAIYLLTSRFTKVALSPRGFGLALWAGFCFTVPAFGLSWLGPEFPSLGGALFGIVLFCLTLLILRRKREDGESDSPWTAIGTLVAAFGPYLLVCLLLLVGKLALGPIVYSASVSDQPLRVSAYQPGVLFLVAIALIAAWRRDHSPRELARLFVVPARRLPGVWLAVFCMAGLAQLIVQLVDLEEALEGAFAGAGGAYLVLALAPLAGAAGAFVAGSATVSCLLTAPFLAQAAELTGASVGLVLGLVLVGAGAGNMISLQNLVVVQATVGLANREKTMLKNLWWPAAVYVALAAVGGIVVWALG